MYEHMGTSLRTNKPFSYNPKNPNNSAVLDHLQKCKCTVSINDFKVIGSAKNDYHLRIKESLVIHKDNPVLNKNVNSIPLSLF